MSSPADPFSILSKGGQAPNFKKPDPKPKVHRYRKGQGPQQEEVEDDDNDDIYPISNYTVNDDQFSVADSSLTNLTTREEEEQLNARLKKRRAIQRSVVVEESKTEEPKEKEHTETQQENRMEEEDDDNAARRRRAKLKEKLLEQEKVVEDDVHLQNMEEEDEVEEEGNQVEEERGIISMLKPVFVSKQERETNLKKFEEETALKEEQNKLKERRKAETKTLLIEANRKDDEVENEENLSGGEMPNDDDDFDEANQLELWKIRELKRIKREREERNKRDKEKAEIERRRRLTDAERLHENKTLGSDDTLKPEKMQLKFMQKYYHKGAFYQDSDDPIFKRDYNQAVGEDLWDKSSLPAILQKRRGQFGMAGASKYTHLTDQDTTNFDPQFRVNDDLLEQSRKKLGGFKGADALDRPSSRKR